LINTIDLDPSTSGQQTSYTDASGNQWSVNTITGEVTFTPATNFTGNATIPYSVQDANGQTATANLTVTVGPPASINGTVFNDADLNGTQAGSEFGIGSVRVDLYDSTGITLIATVTTTAGGSYNFPNLTPGDYLVIQTDLAGYVSTTSNSIPATVNAGGSATINFGDYLLPNSTLSGIIGMVFNDANANGMQDSGETVLSGVTIELKNNVGTVIATTTTDTLGSYSFPNLAAGMYTVTETDPSGYISTTLNNVGVNLSSGTIATVNFGDQTSGAAQIADPAVTKYGSPTSATVGSAVVYTLTVGNNGNINATNVLLTDTKPAFLDLISITISPNPGLTPVISGNTFTINFGTVAPTDSFIVTVVTRVNSLGQPPGGSNNASIITSSVTDRTFNNAFSAALEITSSSGSSVKNARALPDTGFAPGVVTDLSHTPHEAYLNAGDVTLEVPSLGIKIRVVGVPLKDGSWNVSWLGNQAGWLQGTAFPSWNGNSVLTSHVYLSNGLAGPFVNLNKLKFGEKIIVHAYGQKYTFEVQTNALIEPNDPSAFKHEEKPWLTLVTCKEYDEKANVYRKRVVIKAILVRVTPE
jgi:LPXTG-site transpeptidase (sortase) family protein